MCFKIKSNVAPTWRKVYKVLLLDGDGKRASTTYPEVPTDYSDGAEVVARNTVGKFIRTVGRKSEAGIYAWRSIHRARLELENDVPEKEIIIALRVDPKDFLASGYSNIYDYSKGKHRTHAVATYRRAVVIGVVS